MKIEYSTINKTLTITLEDAHKGDTYEIKSLNPTGGTIIIKIE